MYKEILNFSLNSLFNKKYLLIKALAIPFGISIIVHYLFISIEDIQTYYKINGFTFEILFVLLFNIMISTVYAINTHRVLLLNESEIPEYGSIRIGKREFNFILQYLYLILISMGMILVIGALYFLLASLSKTITMAFGIFSIIFLLYVLARLSISFPSIAVDKKLSIKESWNYTKDHKLLCFISIIVIPSFITTFISVVYSYIIGYLVSNISSNFDVFYLILNLLISVITITFLSATYKFIMNDKNETLTSYEAPKNSFYINEEYINDDTYKITFSNNIDESFDYIKEYLINEYKELGFDTKIQEHEDKFYLKKQNEQGSYVFLSNNDVHYVIEVFDTAKPILDFLQKYE